MSSQRSFRWKDTLKPATRMNRLVSNKGVLPDKFSPSRQNSMEVDKLFNASRSRLHASMSAGNHSHEDEVSLDKSNHRLSNRNHTDLPKAPILDKMNSIQNKLLISGSLNGPLFQTSSLIHDHRKQTSKFIPTFNPAQLSELKKQYLSFKQNVLKELDRQREMVEKFVKEIVLTVEFELQKFNKNMNASTQVQTLGGQESASIKTLEEWKSKLGNINIATPSIPEVSEIATPKRAPIIQTINPKLSNLLPSQMPMDMSVFLSTCQRLKRQMQEMDRLFLEPVGKVEKMEADK